MLETPFLHEEIKEVIWNREGEKIPSLNGYNQYFLRVVGTISQGNPV